MQTPRMDAPFPKHGAVPPLTDPFMREPAGYHPAAKNSRDQFRELLDILYRGKWIILTVFVLVVSLAAAYTYTVAPEYEAYSLIHINSQNSSDLSSVLGFGGKTSTWWGANRDIANEMVVLQQSLPMAERVAAELMEIKTVPETGEPLTILQAPEGMEPPTLDDVAAMVQGRIHVAQEGEDVDVVRVTATSTVPGEAALLANLYTEEFRRRTQETSRARVAASRKFLQEQERKLSADLAALEDRVRSYMSQEGAVALDQEAEGTVSQIAQLEAMRDEARVELQMKQASLTSLEEELARIEPRMAERVASGAEKELELAQSRLAELEVERDRIFIKNPELRNGPPNEQLRLINAEIEQLGSKIDDLSKQYVREVMALGGVDMGKNGSGLEYIARLNRQIVDDRIALTGLETKVQVLTQRLNEYSSKLRNLPAQSIQLAQLTRAQQSTERMYLFIVEKLQEARVAEESELGYVDIIRRALVPTYPVRLKKMRTLAMAIVLGLVFGIGLAMARIKLDRRIYRPEDLREMGYTVLGLIPKMDQIIKDDFSGKETITLDGRKISTSLVSLLTPMSPIVEAYRQVRTNIHFSRPDTIVQTLLLTSAGAGEGKTVTACNLAVVMAQSGRKTLLIDADLRRPRTHKVFGLNRQPGLVELLFEHGEIDIERFATGIDDLYIIPAGAITPNPSELLGSRRMRELIAQLRQHFDMIIFDTPPVMVATDPVLLATQCDATIVVTAAGRVETFELEQSMDALANVGAVVIGNLLNGFDASMAHGYKYKYKYYKYGYGSKYGSYYRSAPSESESESEA